MIMMSPQTNPHRRAFLKVFSTTAGAIAVDSQFSERAAAQSVDRVANISSPKDHSSGANSFAPVSAGGGRSSRHSIELVRRPGCCENSARRC